MSRKDGGTEVPGSDLMEASFPGTSPSPHRQALAEEWKYGKIPAPSDAHADSTSSWQDSVTVNCAGSLPARTLMSLSLCRLWGTSMATVAGQLLCAPWP